MAGDPTLIWLNGDPAIERLAATLRAGATPAGPAGELLFKAARIATDITVIRSSLMTLGIAEAVIPVLPGITKLGAIGAAALAAVALVASTIDIVVQLGQLKASMGLLAGVPDSELKDVTDRLEALSDPLGAIMDKVIEYLGKAGLIDADMAGLFKEMKDFNEARAAAAKAVSPQDKLRYNLAGIDAARSFLDKLGPTLKDKIKDKIKKEQDQAERDWNERQLRDQEPDHNGVDYPNPPGNSGPYPGGNGGTAVA